MAFLCVLVQQAAIICRPQLSFMLWAQLELHAEKRAAAQSLPQGYMSACMMSDKLFSGCARALCQARAENAGKSSTSRTRFLLHAPKPADRCSAV